MRIYIDLDNTICKTHEYFLYNCKVRFGRHDLFYDKEKLRASDYHLTEWFVNSNLATEIEARAMKEIIFNDENYWATIPPMEDAVEVIERLSKKHEIFIASDAITVNNDVCMTGKKKWLKRFLPFIKSSQLIFIQNKSMLVGNLLIEDVVEQIINFKGRTMLFDYFYNRTCLPSWRVNTWKEAEEIILNYL